MTDPIRVRIAPSPTGTVHLGLARTSLFNWAQARRQGGTFVLRIEDTDDARNHPQWTQGIIDSLAWIGISADDPHFEGPRFQSDDSEAHVRAAQRLYEEGKAYYCDLTADQVQERAKELGIAGYDGYSRDRGLGPGPGRVLRFRAPDEGTTVVHDEVRGEVSFELARDEIIALGREQGFDSDPLHFFAAMGRSGGGAARSEVVALARSLKGSGLQTALVTNNVAEFRSHWRATLPVDELFHHVVDSSEVGLRKPDRRIFELALERVGGVAPERAVFLDDYEGNVEAARSVGIRGILVTGDYAAALEELRQLLS